MELIRREGRRAVGEGETGVPPEGGRPSGRSVLALMALALLLVVAFLQFSPPASNAVASEFASFLSSLGHSGNTNSSASSFAVYSPLISNGAANITYPADYRILSAFALSLINQDRANFSASAVSLGDSSASQQHADSMLRYGYFSHFDTQGFKPYMRYTLLAGVGADFENVAYISWQGNHFSTTSAAEDSISTLEEQMMYNDSVCCGNGHRLNIIGTLHNRVSLGIAYNSTTLFFVEEFENYYVNLSYNMSKGYTFAMSGPVTTPVASPTQIYMAYDPAPTSETPAQLNAGPREYGPGELIGGVLPPCSRQCSIFASGVTVRATVWQVTSTDVSIVFDLSRFIQVHGAGVYTVYLLTGADTSTALTSISIFVT